jgi:hypothetical protein
MELLISRKIVPCCLFVALVANVIICNILIILPMYDFKVSSAMVNLEIVLNIILNLTDLGRQLSNFSLRKQLLCSCSFSIKYISRFVINSKMCIVYLYYFGIVWMVIDVLKPRTTIYGIVSLFDSSYAVDGYWKWFGILNITLASYTVVTHMALLFLLWTLLHRKQYVCLPFGRIFAPMVTSILYLLACLWILLDHSSGN